MELSEKVRQQFIEYIMLMVYDDQYIDRHEEKKILEEGIRRGIRVEDGLSIIKHVAAEKGLVVEREVEESVKDILRQYALDDGLIGKDEFEDALAMFNDVCKGKISESELKKRLKKMILDNGWKAKEGGLFGGGKWFSSI